MGKGTDEKSTEFLQSELKQAKSVEQFIRENESDLKAKVFRSI